MGQLKGLAAILKGGMSATAEEELLPAEEQGDDSGHRSRPQIVDRSRGSAAKKVALTKSKDPAWKAYSLFLKKETHSEMNFLLRKKDAGEDMSDLVQGLVEKWVIANR